MEKNTGKVREKSGNFVSPEKWEPCVSSVPSLNLHPWGNCKLQFAETLRARVFTARNKVGARLCFYTCLWFCSQGGGLPHCMLGYPRDQRQAPLGADTPLDQAPPRAEPPGPAPPPKEQTPQCSTCLEIRATSGRYASYYFLDPLVLRSFVIKISTKSENLDILIKRLSERLKY